MLSKTLKASTKKTESVLRNKHFIPVVALIVIGLSLIGLLVFHPAEKSLKFGDKKIIVKIANTQESRERGLGGLEKLGGNEGMLFSFESSDMHCFWMKDMQFPIDIIWLNEQKTIVDIKKNVMPDTYPESFCPQDKSLYVLEVNSGMADRARVGVGTKL